MDALRIKLMHREAVNRQHDAAILSKNLSRASDSNYLLELLAFEILLKAVALIHTQRFDENHNYQQLFESLPSAIRVHLRARATHWSQKAFNKPKLQKLLNLYRSNFVRLRYPFEAYNKMTESEYLEYGNLWVELGAPIEEAEFQYYPEEIWASKSPTGRCREIPRLQHVPLNLVDATRPSGRLTWTLVTKVKGA